MGDQLVQEIGAFSFNFYMIHGSEDPGGYHKLFLNDLEAWLRAKGYETAREKSVIYEHRDRKSDALSSKRGSIDLYAKNKGRKVAVEFDNGKRLKFKSMEKLNNCDADVLVGVIAGGFDKRSVINNCQRYSETANNNSSVSRDVWLVIMSERRIELLSMRWKDGTPFDLKPVRMTKADSGIMAKAFTDKKRYTQRAIEEY